MNFYRNIVTADNVSMLEPLPSYLDPYKPRMEIVRAMVHRHNRLFADAGSVVIDADTFKRRTYEFYGREQFEGHTILTYREVGDK